LALGTGGSGPGHGLGGGHSPRPAGGARLLQDGGGVGRLYARFGPIGKRISRAGAVGGPGRPANGQGQAYHSPCRSRPGDLATAVVVGPRSRATSSVIWNARPQRPRARQGLRREARASTHPRAHTTPSAYPVMRSMDVRSSCRRGLGIARAFQWAPLHPRAFGGSAAGPRPRVSDPSWPATDPEPAARTGNRPTSTASHCRKPARGPAFRAGPPRRRPRRRGREWRVMNSGRAGRPRCPVRGRVGRPGKRKHRQERPQPLAPAPTGGPPPRECAPWGCPYSQQARPHLHGIAQTNGQQIQAETAVIRRAFAASGKRGPKALKKRVLSWHGRQLNTSCQALVRARPASCPQRCGVRPREVGCRRNLSASGRRSGRPGPVLRSGSRRAKAGNGVLYGMSSPFARNTTQKAWQASRIMVAVLDTGEQDVSKVISTWVRQGKRRAAAQQRRRFLHAG